MLIAFMVPDEILDKNVRNDLIFVFDMGGVVIKWPGNDPIFRHIARKYSVPVEKMREAMQADLLRVESGKLGTYEYLKRSLKRVGRTMKENDSADGLLAHPFEKLVKLNQHSVKLIKFLRRRGYKALALTNTSPPHLEVMKRLRWTDLFDRFFASCELKSIKPEKEIYLIMLRSIRAEPEKIVFIDDRLENIQGARSVGITNGILFRSMGSLRAEISNLIEPESHLLRQEA